MEKIVPERRRHGKSTRILDTSILNTMYRSPEVTDHVYHPAVLHEIGATQPWGLICAECVRGKRKGHVIFLRLVIPETGKPHWVRFDQFVKRVMTAANPLVPEFVKRVLPSDAWATIHCALHLEGLDTTV